MQYELPSTHGQPMENPSTPDESTTDTDTETGSISSEDASYDKPVNPYPVPDADDRR